MPSAQPPMGQFIAWESLGTLGGATLATFVITNVLRRVFGINAAWCGFLVAQAVCIGSTLHATQSVEDLPLAMLNGCLVFLSAAGTTEAAAGLVSTRSPRAVARGGDTAKRPGLRPLFRPWFLPPSGGRN